MPKLTVSAIVPTYNSASTLEACLKSIKSQSYPCDIIVVDNFSKDSTEIIAKKYASEFFIKGPERSAQRNFGVSQVKSDIVLIIDSDMELSPGLVEECINLFKRESFVGLVVPEESFGKGFWAQCKKLERSFYVGIEWMEAARVFRRDTYLSVGGYNELMVSGEDWDLSQRISKFGTHGRTKLYIRHNEGHLNLRKTLNKKYYYAKNFSTYKKVNADSTAAIMQTSLGERYKLFFRHPIKLMKNPILGIGMLFMKSAEFAYGGMGLLMGKKYFE